MEVVVTTGLTSCQRAATSEHGRTSSCFFLLDVEFGEGCLVAPLLTGCRCVSGSRCFQDGSMETLANVLTAARHCYKVSLLLPPSLHTFTSSNSSGLDYTQRHTHTHTQSVSVLTSNRLQTLCFWTDSGSAFSLFISADVAFTSLCTEEI